MTSKTRAEHGDVSLTAEKQYKRGEHPNSQSNLQPFEKGISGNPSGRPYKYENLKKALDVYGNHPSSDWNNVTNKENVLKLHQIF
mgnify:CR=1 FL=1